MLGNQKSSKECYVKAITAGNKRKPTEPRRNEEYQGKQEKGKVRKTGEGGEKEKGKGPEEVISMEKPIRPYIEPVGEVLSIELFPGRKGFLTKTGENLGPKHILK